MESKLKPAESKIKPDFKVADLDLEKSHPIRDLDANFIINKLESEIKKRESILTEKLRH